MKRRGKAKVNQLELFGETFTLRDGGPSGGGYVPGDPMPAGPLMLGLLWHFADDMEDEYAPPFSVVARDGVAVCPMIGSLEIAKAVRDALNLAYPVAP